MNDDILESTLYSEESVLESLISLINKNEMYIESGYIYNEGYDNFVNEMFQIYMESTDRYKQKIEIENYIKDKGLTKRLGADGSLKEIRTAEKLKKIRASEEEYNDSLIKDAFYKKTGKKLNSLSPEELAKLPNEEQQILTDIDDDLTKHKKYKRLTSGKTYKQMTPKQQMRLVNTLLQLDFDPKTETIRSDVKNKDGSYKRIKIRLYMGKNMIDDLGNTYNSPQVNTSDSISIPVHTLIRSQATGQAILHHELGHHKSTERQREITGDEKQTHGYHTLDTSNNNIANKFIDDAKKEGKNIDDHDDSSYMHPEGKRNGEELYADLNGILKTAIRTSKWGNKSSGKGYKDKLNEGTRQIRKHEVIQMFNYLSICDKYISDSEEFIFDYINRMDKALSGILSRKKFNPNDVMTILQTVSDKYDKLENKSVKSKEEIDRLKKMIHEYNTTLQSIKRVSKSHPEQRQGLADLSSKIKSLNETLKIEESKLLDINRKIGKLENLFSDTSSLQMSPYMDDKPNNATYKKYEPFIIELHSEIKEMRTIATKRIKDSKIVMSDGTKMRYDFVMKYGEYADDLKVKKNNGFSKKEKLAKKREKMNKQKKIVKEYFDVFFTEYYSINNLIDELY